MWFEAKSIQLKLIYSLITSQVINPRYFNVQQLYSTAGSSFVIYEEAAGDLN